VSCTSIYRGGTGDKKKHGDFAPRAQLGKDAFLSSRSVWLDDVLRTLAALGPSVVSISFEQVSYRLYHASSFLSPAHTVASAARPDEVEHHVSNFFSNLHLLDYFV
jgi:hypothetical protein